LGVRAARRSPECARRRGGRGVWECASVVAGVAELGVRAGVAQFGSARAVAGVAEFGVRAAVT